MLQGGPKRKTIKNFQKKKIGKKIRIIIIPRPWYRKIKWQERHHLYLEHCHPPPPPPGHTVPSFPGESLGISTASNGCHRLGNLPFPLPVLLSALFFVPFGGHEAIQLGTVLHLNNNAAESNLMYAATRVWDWMGCEQGNVGSTLLPGKSRWDSCAYKWSHLKS